MKRSFWKSWNLIACVPAILMVLLIFYFSTQPGEVSEVTSGSVAERIYDVLDHGEHPLDVVQQDMFNSLIRVFAHITEFATLAVLIGLAATANGIRSYLRSFYMFGLSVPVAMVDELLQLCVPGRECDIIDLCKDLVGAGLLAVLFFLFSVPRTLKTVHIDPDERRRAFMNIHIDDVAFTEAVERIRTFAGTDGVQMVITPNADHIVKAEQDAEFRSLYEQADLVVPDGMPLLWIADSLGCPLLERVTGADLLPEVCAFAEQDQRRIFILATDEKTITAAVKQIRAQYPKLPAVDGYAPSMNFSEDAEESRRILEKVEAFGTDILVVGLGAPKSEKWIAEHKAQLACKVALPFGAAVSFIAKEKRRAPKWMRKHGLEWFSRFLQEPVRLFRRYFIEDSRIFLLALKYRDRTICGYTGEDRPEK